jgi:hypothetical protein
VLSEHVPPDAVVDYLNIDVELMEENILAEWDFERWKPAVISVEIHAGIDIASVAVTGSSFVRLSVRSGRFVRSGVRSGLAARRYAGTLGCGETPQHPSTHYLRRVPSHRPSDR